MKNTKKALLLSVMSLVLCVSMLVGTTFAWFTDSVSTGKNVIAAGNLDVQLFYKLDKNAAWAEVDTDTELFDDAALWEPGYTQVVYLKVANAGSLALKYQLGLNIVSETQGKNVDGDLFSLSDYIEFDAIETDTENFYADRKAAREAVTDSKIISAGYSKASKLYATNNVPAGGLTEEYVALVVYMPEEVDNVANYRDIQPKITLGLDLVATQLEAEEDSFDETYDKDAWADGWEVRTEADLLAALNNGKPIVLMDDIVLTASLEIPAGADIKLNLNGKTLSAATSEPVIVNNGTLSVVGGTIENTAPNGGSTIMNAGKLTLKDTAVVGAPLADGGYPGYCILSTGDLTVEEGTEVSADRGCLRLEGTGETVINGGTFTNNDLVRTFTAHVVYIPSGVNNKLTINGGTFQNLDADTSGGVVINNRSAVTAEINGGSFSGGNYFGKWDNLSDYGQGATATPFSVKGGTFTGMDNNYLAAGYKAVLLDGKYVVLPESTDPVADAAGMNSALAAGKDVLLTDDVTTGADFTADNTTIDLGANTLTMTNSDQTVTGNLAVSNGTVDTSKGYFDVRPTTDSTVVIEDVVFNNTTKNKTFGSCTNRVESSLEFCPGVDDVKTTFVFKNCTFNNTNVLFEGTSDKSGVVEAVFENCTFNLLGTAAPIEVVNYITADFTVKDCTFNITATGTVYAVEKMNSSTVNVTFEGNNILNGVKATPTTDPALVGTVDEIKTTANPSVKLVWPGITVTGAENVTVQGIATK